MNVTANVNRIDTPDWSMSLDGVGQVVRDGDDIAQSIKIIVMTEKGSDPLRPGFGSDVAQIVDQPIDIAIGALKRNIIEQVERWEPRAEIEQIDHDVEGEKITLSVVWRDRRTGTETQTEVSI